MTTFNPNEHLMQIKSSQGSKDYLPVAWRLVWFNELCPQGQITILEQLIDLDREITKEVYQWNPEKRRSELVPKTAKGYAWFKIRAEDGKGKIGEAFGSECAVDFDDFAEKADTKATGRALAKIGYGTQFAAGELDEEHRVVDSPVDRDASSDANNHNGNGNGRKPIVAVRSNAVNGHDQATDSAATDQQLASIRKLCQHLGKTEPEGIETFDQAKDLLAQLSQEYRNSRRAS